MIDTQTIKSKLKELNQNIETLVCSFLNDIKEQINQIKEPNEFKRLNRDEIYYVVSKDEGIGKFIVGWNSDSYSNYDNEHFNNNNYFFTRERAQEVADKINFLLKLERLHDEFCFDYKPNWRNRNETKYYVYYNSEDDVYDFSYAVDWGHENIIYFPTEEIIQKVVNILNTT